ncbi:MAG: AAA family ATPase [Candidatus Helarchaeota archaeon]
MILNYLFLKNFRSYSEATINFIDGYNVILGQNGSGKTNILLGIGFALFGSVKKDGKEVKLKDLVRRGEKKCAVALEFTVSRITYRVERTIDLNKNKTTAKLYKNDAFVSENSKTVTSDIESILKFNKLTFENIVYIGQGEIPKIASQEPNKRKKIFDKLLGLSAYEWAHENLKDVKKTIKNELEVKNEKYKFYQEHLKELPLKKEQLKNNTDELKELIEEKEQLKEKYENKKKELDDLEEIKKKLDIISRDLSNYETNLIKLHSQLIKKGEFVEKKLNRPIELDEQYIRNIEQSLIDKERSIKQDIIIIQAAIDFQKELEFNLQKNESDLKKYLNKSKELNNYIENKINLSLQELPALNNIPEDQWESFIAQELSNLNSQSSSLAKKKEEIIKKEKELKMKKEGLSKYENKLGDIEKKYETKRLEIGKIDTNWETLIKNYSINDLQASVGKLNEDIELHNKKINELNTDFNIKNSKLLEIQNDINNIEKLKQDAQCPVCKQMVSGQYKELILQQLKKTLETLESEMEELKVVINNEKSILNELNNTLQNKMTLIDKLQKIFMLNKELEHFSDEINDVKNEINSLKEDISKIYIENPSEYYDKEINKTQEHINRVKNIESDIKILSEKRKELGALKLEIEKLNEDRKSIEEKFDKSKLDQDLNKRSLLDEELNDITLVKQSLTNILEIIKDENEIEVVLNERKKEYKSLNEKFDPKLYSALNIEVKELSKNYNEKTGAIIQIKEKIIPNIKREINKLLKEKEELEKINEDLYHLKRQLNLVEIIRQFFREIPQILIQQRTRKISEKATELLKLILPSTEFDKIVVEKNYDLKVYRFGNAENISQLSSGEQIVVCLAIRLAISDILAGRELIMLDEPTANLDSENIKHLVDIFYQFRPSTQMITITHDSEFEKIADNLLNVEKKNGLESEIY